MDLTDEELIVTQRKRIETLEQENKYLLKMLKRFYIAACILAILMAVIQTTIIICEMR